MKGVQVPYIFQTRRKLVRADPVPCVLADKEFFRHYTFLSDLRCRPPWTRDIPRKSGVFDVIWPLTLALNPKTVGIVGGVVVLTTLSSYALGYLKGANRPGAQPQVIQVTSDITKDQEKAEKSQRLDAVKTDEDVMVVETKLPPTTLPDGSVEQRTRIRRQTAKQESTDSQSTSQGHTVEKIVEKRVEVPCPALPNPFEPEVTRAPLPRWQVGPSVARDFSLDKTIYGASLAVRAGPVWFRVFADSHPQAGVSAEVNW